MKTVLIVEDMRDFSDGLKFVLTHKGYKVVTAADGAEGLEKAISIKPDLILMDINMPGQDGPETVLKIREHQSLAHVPIVFLTALASDAGLDTNVVVIHGREYSVISKMTDQEEIVRQVCDHLYSA